MSTQNLSDKAAIGKLTELVNGVKVCMLATVDKDYGVKSRPMYTVQVDEEGNIWFFTNEFSGKAEDISKDNTVYLMYSHPDVNSYVHIKGTATINKDKAKIEQLWAPMVKAWFPGGADDPALSLLKVTTEEASYWDGASNKFVQFFYIAKAGGDRRKV